ncbi:MAG: hypothetical protein AAF682_29615 [Planctomycetota bacterium]
MATQQAPTTSPAKWIELIRVRASQSVLQAAMPSLRTQVEEIEAASDVAETYFLQHALYDGDLAVVLVWRERPAVEQTREGHLVAEALQRLGSVDHAVWVPAAAS